MADIQTKEPSFTSHGVHSSHEVASTDPKPSPEVSIERLHNPWPQDHAEHMPKTIHEKSFAQGLLRISWIIHVIAVGATIGAVQLSFNRFYWFDEKTSALSWRKYSIDEQTNKKALQFVAKLHEALIVSSLSAMVLHIVRRMLIGNGPGLSFGLLAGAYRLGSIPWLFSTSFWTPLKDSKHYQNFLFAVGLGFVFVYANIVGPSSAIVIIPTLDWWPVAHPYDGREKLTTYIMAPRENIFPDSLNLTNDYANCTTPFAFCPGGGFRDLSTLIGAYAIGGIETETQIKHPTAETYRILNSSLDYAGGDNGAVAIATTPHSSAAALIGLFWNHIKKNEAGIMSGIKRPRFQPSEDIIFAPLVQVQCSRFSREMVDAGYEIPFFNSSGMRNFSGLLDDDNQSNYYQSRPKWELEERYWMKQNDSLRTTFEWLDLASKFPEERPSLGAVATVPIIYQEELDDGTEVDRQDSLIVPCIIDARWAGVSTTFDPGSETSLGLVPSNLTDLSKLERFWNPESDKPHPGGLTSRNIPISPEWAELLNLNITSREGTENTTAVRSLLGIFVYSINSTEGEVMTDFKSPWSNRTGPSFQDPSYDVSNYDFEMNDIARTVATILSLVVADGMSRVSHLSQFGVVLHENNSETVFWKDLYYQTGWRRTEPREVSRAVLQDWLPIEWEVYRYGWGYGLKGIAVYFGIAILLIHVCMVVVYAAYMVWFRTRPVKEGWASTAWDTLQELLAFALISPPPEGNIGKMRGVANGEADDTTLAKTVKVRAQGGEDLVLVI
ncbi:hypothetical protein NM208_g1377 [Fusarium decemcellulare]|uniref:Uncharacterized protein n=2 Tax=Fusarium decemcellulare TaxID=57161 RepID=A0ACC1SW47_9HYPO|nr:hypothetical protein NM208_g2469 [Fusarium decemcellulare]KAJ3547689.1 hypothetical protein NM208_g1377 [Fusarium decemcellulare]